MSFFDTPFAIVILKSSLNVIGQQKRPSVGGQNCPVWPHTWPLLAVFPLIRRELARYLFVLLIKNVSEPSYPYRQNPPPIVIDKP
jgi:hypothetical protein